MAVASMRAQLVVTVLSLKYIHISLRFYEKIFTHDKMPITNSKVMGFRKINTLEIWILNPCRDGWILA